MRNYKKIVSLVALVALLVVFQPVFAKSDKGGDLPEQDGVYNVAGHPELKMRVFVHKARPERTPAPAPVEQCGLADAGSEAVVSPAGWHLPQNSTGYYLNIASVPSSVGAANWLKIAQNSFGAWESELGGYGPQYLAETSINRAARDGKNVVSWGRTSSSALAVTYTWYNSLTGEAVETDTIMNQKYVWNWSNPAGWPMAGETCAFAKAYDAQDILTHEIGHWFGLNDHYTFEYANNTMYGYGAQTETKKDTLSIGDISGLKNVYGL